MSEFDFALPPFRLAQTHHGDTLQEIATRELGDANRWIELVWLNQLTYPYLRDGAEVVPGTIRRGGNIRVPAVSGVPTDTADGDDGGYGQDCALVNRLLDADASGDFSLVSGVLNLKQQLKHRLDTPMGQQRRHPEYGCRIWQLRGNVNGPLLGFMGARYVKSALLADYRVAGVSSSTADIVGDKSEITARVQAKAGGSVDVVTAQS